MKFCGNGILGNKTIAIIIVCYLSENVHVDVKEKSTHRQLPKINDF